MSILKTWIKSVVYTRVKPPHIKHHANILFEIIGGDKKTSISINYRY